MSRPHKSAAASRAVPRGARDLGRDRVLEIGPVPNAGEVVRDGESLELRIGFLERPIRRFRRVPRLDQLPLEPLALTDVGEGADQSVVKDGAADDDILDRPVPARHAKLVRRHLSLLRGCSCDRRAPLIEHLTAIVFVRIGPHEPRVVGRDFLRCPAKGLIEFGVAVEYLLVRLQARHRNTDRQLLQHCAEMTLALLRRALGPLQGGDVPRHPEQFHRDPVRGVNRQHVDVAPDGRTVLAAIFELVASPLQRESSVEEKRQTREIVQRDRLRLRREDFLEPLLHGLRWGEAAQSFSRRTDVGDPAIQGHGPDDIRCVLSQQTISCRADLQPLLGLPTRLLDRDQRALGVLQPAHYGLLASSRDRGIHPEVPAAQRGDPRANLRSRGPEMLPHCGVSPPKQDEQARAYDQEDGRRARVQRKGDHQAGRQQDGDQDTRRRSKRCHRGRPLRAPLSPAVSLSRPVSQNFTAVAPLTDCFAVSE